MELQVGEIMSTQTFKFPDQLMADGTIPELIAVAGEDLSLVISDQLELWRWLSSVNSPMSIDDIQLRLNFEDRLPTPEQTTKILEAMANLMVVVSRVGYEMAQAKHQGGEG